MASDQQCCGLSSRSKTNHSPLKGYIIDKTCKTIVHHKDMRISRNLKFGVILGLDLEAYTAAFSKT